MRNYYFAEPDDYIECYFEKSYLNSDQLIPGYFALEEISYYSVQNKVNCTAVDDDRDSAGLVNTQRFGKDFAEEAVDCRVA